MNHQIYYKILKQCDGVEKFEQTSKDWMGRIEKHEKLRKVGPIIPTREIFIKVTATAVKGSIGRVIEFDADYWENDENGKVLSTYGGSVVYEVDGRPKPHRVQTNHCDILGNYNGQTVWVKPVRGKKKPKPKYEPFVNKYNQTVNMGDWIVGQAAGKRIAFGKVVRFTHANIWVTTDLESDKPNTIMVNHPKETFVLPRTDDSDYEKHIMMTVLQGWSGRQ